MSSIRLDKVILSSLHEAFRNRERLTASIAISGSVPASSSVNFDTDFSILRNGGIAEVYYEKTGGNPRRKGDSGIVLYDYSGSGTAQMFITNPTANTLRVRISVFNPSGSPINLTAQTYNITAYIFDTPFSS